MYKPTRISPLRLLSRPRTRRFATRSAAPTSCTPSRAKRAATAAAADTVSVTNGTAYAACAARSRAGSAANSAPLSADGPDAIAQRDNQDTRRTGEPRFY